MSDKSNQRPVCRYCQSENISTDATARWNNDKKDWELSGILDGGSCDDCQEEMKFFDWVNIKPQPGRAIPEHHVKNFEVLKQAILDGNAALMTCGSKEGTRTVICMVNRHLNGDCTFVPVGEMCEGENPFQHYVPPFPEKEDGS